MSPANPAGGGSWICPCTALRAQPGSSLRPSLAQWRTFYRGEVYRSTIWRTRLDNTTNWSVVTLGVALSITFSDATASPLPLLLVGFLILFFLMLGSRRYRYFNVWRARARWMDRHLYAPMLDDGDLHMEEGWQRTLARDYREAAVSHRLPSSGRTTAPSQLHLDPVDPDNCLLWQNHHSPDTSRQRG